MAEADPTKQAGAQYSVPIHEDDDLGIPVKLNKQSKTGNSKTSLGTSQYSTNSVHAAREVSETFSLIFYEMRWALLSVACNAVLIWLISQLQTVDGVYLGLDEGAVHAAFGVSLEILLLIANILGLIAMDAGAAASFGYLLCQKQGTSLAVCGFSQAPALKKVNFAQQLSLNSTVRKILSRLSLFWFTMEAMKLLTPLAATGIHAETPRHDDGTINCIIFRQEGELIDRGWPNIDAASGVSELVFGKSLGLMRSQENVNITSFVMAPQLIGAVNDGDTLLGDGFIVEILTSCTCKRANTAAELIADGFDSTLAASFLDAYESMNDEIGVISHFVENENNITVTTALHGYGICGGYKTRELPVCTTEFSNHIHATIQMEYGTDGTPASIASLYANIRERKGPANITWLAHALNSMFPTSPTLNGNGTDLSITYLPPTVPGMINPIMYWTTSDLLAINPSLFEAGIETFFSISLRSGIMRTFDTYGSDCTKNVAIENTSQVHISDYAAIAAYIGLIFQLIMSVGGCLAFVPWVISQSPIGPAVRIIQHSEYFTTFLRNSSIASNLEGLCNAPKHSIWQALDVNVRVGEAVGSRDEVVGTLTLDKPKMVRELINGRRYQ